MKICFLIKNLRGNGANRVNTIYANELSKRGNTVVIFIENFIESNYVLNENIKLLCIRKFKEVSYQFDFCISTFYSNHKYLKYCKKESRIQLIQDNYYRYLSITDSRKKIIDNAINDKSVLKIVPSNYLKEYYKDKNVSCYVVENAINNNVFYLDKKIKKKETRIIVEGFIDRPYLNVKTAYSVIPKRYKIWGLSFKDHINMDYDKMFVNIKTDNKLNYIFNSCAFILELEKNEGFNLVLLESMATGCIVITTNCGGHMDYCIHLENSIILNKIEELEYYLDLVRNNSELKNKLIQNGIKTAKKYSWENSISKFENVLKLKK